MPSSVDLAALLCSRLCHDMLSPIGALNNGLELLADERDPEMRAKCMDLLEQSARASADKLKFFRLAFGAAGGYGEMVEVAESRAAIDSLIGENKRITANWALADSKLPKDAIKVLLNLAHIAIDALIRGGTLDIGAERRDGATEIVVRASGPRLAFDEDIGHALQGELDPDQLTGRTAPAHMLHLLADRAGGGLQYQLGDGMLVLGAVLPEPEGLIG
ncbi:histidine phosphotransferase family protein [Parerythrobacter lacustris]|uniref:Histidine phosphotransferase family protein n=1 Tax=Parerythrobacter lacustris TaxID=2969984 RepID=A0ABT1XT03_9SPHN|nr:histidine phosphotransferase family protein [Parerythrobacter lacustris]MCR2834793.1 histidine phosphotransferase family protein [Parerythrobacter lacustris]